MKRISSFLLTVVLIVLCIPITSAGVTSADTDTVVMDYNHGTKSADFVAELVNEYQPDTFGLQEDHYSFVSELSDLLGHGYAYVGSASKGHAASEHCSIFYNASKLELIESGTRWLSKTPDEVSFGEDESQSQQRIMTYALFERKSDGAHLLHVNTHLDNKGGWLEQIGYILDFVNKNYSGYPTVLTGDFNRNPNSDTYSAIISNGFSDSRLIARTVDDELGYTIDTVTDGSVLVRERIDFCFFKNMAYVSSYKLHTDGIEDDHFPIVAEYDIAIRGEVDNAAASSGDYAAGYVLHNMDLAQIPSLSSTNYRFSVNTSANGGSASENFVLRNSSMEGETDKKVLFYDYNRNGKNAGHGFTWFVGNEIPTDIQSYTVEYKFRVTSYYNNDTSKYFCFMWGSSDGDTVSKLGDVGLRLRGSIDNSSATYESSQAELASAIQGGYWVTYRIIVDGTKVNATVSCNGQNASFTVNKDASSGNCIGMLQGDGTATEVASVRVIAGTPDEYSDSGLLWPGTENALVQTLGDYARANVLANTSENDYQGYFQRSKDNSAFRILLVTDRGTLPDNQEMKITVSYEDTDSSKKQRSFTVNSSRFKAYFAVEAANELYIAANGQYIFGAVIVDIPTNITLTSISVSFGDSYNVSADISV